MKSSPPATTPHPVLRKYYDGATDRQPFVTGLFDGAARYYERVCDVGSLGSSRFYRGWIMRQTGLARGMTVLDVATGTGLMARSAARIVEDGHRVVGLDPSAGMLAEARRRGGPCFVQGQAETLPFADAHFDYLTMAYALRHVADLDVTFREFLRVLKPGGRVLLLEISRPRSAVMRFLLRVHLQTILPRLVQMSAPGARLTVLTQYYWDTIAECVEPETIIDVMRRSGFAGVERRVRGGMLSEYVAVKPHPSANDERGRIDATKTVASHRPQ